MNKAYLFIDSHDGEKKPLNYETTLARFGEYLTPQAKTEIFEFCSKTKLFKNENDFKITLLSAYEKPSC